MRGTQSVQRALSLLRLVARRPEGGVKLAALVRESGLDRGTAYRLLSCLVEEEFLIRDEAQEYRLGSQATLLGSLLPSAVPLQTRFSPTMKRLARITEDTIFLMIRRGDCVQCDHREVGGSFVKILTTDIGQRRLLGVGTGGAAVLGLLSPAELDLIWTRNRSAYEDQGITQKQLRATAQAARVRGYATTFDQLEAGVAGLGVAFRIGIHAMGAISIATLTPRLVPERERQLVSLISAELEALGLASG